MRGGFTDQGGLFSYIAPDKRVPANHPLRKVRELVRDVSSDLNRSLGRIYAERGTSFDPPGAIAERLAAAGVLRHPLATPVDGATGLQSFVPLVRGTVAGRSGLGPDHLHQEPGAVAERRSVHEVHDQAFEPSAGQAAAVGRALFGAWNVDRSLGFTEELRPRDCSGDDDDGANFHGQKRKNDTHASTSDPDSRLYRKAAGREAKLCYMRHATMENRMGWRWPAGSRMPMATAERRASEAMLKARRKAAGRRITAGEDKAYDTADHVANLRAIGVTPHVNTEPGRHQNRQDPHQRHRRTNHAAFGIWHVAITPGDGRVHLRMGQAAWHHAQDQTSWHRSRPADFLLNLIAYNLIRIPKLLAP